jgi:hypothetical protein
MSSCLHCFRCSSLSMRGSTNIPCKPGVFHCINRCATSVIGCVRRLGSLISDPELSSKPRLTNTNRIARTHACTHMRAHHVAGYGWSARQAGGTGRAASQAQGHGRRAGGEYHEEGATAGACGGRGVCVLWFVPCLCVGVMSRREDIDLVLAGVALANDWVTLDNYCKPSGSCNV